MQRSVLAGFACVAVFAAPAAAQTNWAEVLRRDAQALRDTYADSHPGPVDPQNPAFATKMEAGLKQALERAEQVTTYGGYRAAMDEYVAAFDDGHVSIGPTKEAPPLQPDWAGFLTRMTIDDRHIVAVRSDAAAPPEGAELTSCDGRPVDAVAQARIGRLRGRWSHRSTRFFYGPRLLVDYGDPFSPRPRACEFKVGATTRSYPLEWRAISPDELRPLMAKAVGRFTAPIEIRDLGPRRYWISLGSFDSSPGTDSAKQLAVVLEEAERRKSDLRAAELIVFDLRGNNGGSSHYSDRLARTVWGGDWIDAHEIRSGGVDWRASEANIGFFTKLAADKRAAPDHDAEQVAWIESMAAGMRSARAAGKALWREPDEPHAAKRAPPKAPATKARVLFVTDSGCGSACLDAADIWRAAGAVHLGHETAADSLYMDIRPQVLPSGYLRVSVPMKVYRDRPRGSNVPYQPHIPFKGDLADTGALETWILSLPR